MNYGSINVKCSFTIYAMNIFFFLKDIIEKDICCKNVINFELKALICEIFTCSNTISKE
jgi:hypothetical protein